MKVKARWCFAFKAWQVQSSAWGPHASESTRRCVALKISTNSFNSFTDSLQTSGAKGDETTKCDERTEEGVKAWFLLPWVLKCFDFYFNGTWLKARTVKKGHTIKGKKAVGMNGVASTNFWLVFDAWCQACGNRARLFKPLAFDKAKNPLSCEALQTDALPARLHFELASCLHSAWSSSKGSLLSKWNWQEWSVWHFGLSGPLFCFFFCVVALVHFLEE